jgi:hypothetical protein
LLVHGPLGDIHDPTGRLAWGNFLGSWGCSVSCWESNTFLVIFKSVHLTSIYYILNSIREKQNDEHH